MHTASIAICAIKSLKKMFTHKDIEVRTIFVLNCLEQERRLRVQAGELLLEEITEEKNNTLTKFPFQKILALFIIGHITITTPLIEKCRKFNVALVVMKPNLRPVFYWSDTAEGNYLLRNKQHSFAEDDLSVARVLIANKISNQLRCLEKTRKKDEKTLNATLQCKNALQIISTAKDHASLLGLEGSTSRIYFSAYFQHLEWIGRKPRIKCDVINVVLDIGYTILFNFIECFVRMFGFDLYVGVYHRLWFKRKSLICDLMEPFRCLIDHTVLLAFNRKQISKRDFEFTKGEYRLKLNKSADYYKLFYNILIEKKMDIFNYIQKYYRCFMAEKPMDSYPKYLF